jgi:hypothetical protein
MKSWLVGCVLALFAVGCGGVEPQAQVEEEAKVCPALAFRCDPPCKQTGGGCPVQCHCPEYTKCGDTLRCAETEVCCTGPILISGGNSQPYYSCHPAGPCP